MKIVYSPSSIAHANECLMRMYLLDIEKIDHSYTGQQAKGTFVHRFMQISFFNEDGSPKYKSAESCANAAGGSWLYRYANEGVIDNKKIEWTEEKQKYYLKGEIINVMKKAYPRYVREGKPAFSEERFSFITEDIDLGGKADEIRKGPVIRDLKTGTSFNPEDERNHIQEAFYKLGLAAKIHQSPGMAETLGVSPAAAASFAEDPGKLISEIAFEFYHMNFDRIVEPKGKYGYKDIIDMAKGIYSGLKEGFTPPRGSSICTNCSAKKTCYARPGDVFKLRQDGKQLKLFPTDQEIFARASSIPAKKKRKVEDKNQLSLF